MTRQEAIEALNKGHKVTHRYFTRSEWVRLQDGLIVTEDGCKVKPIIFWMDRQHGSWEDDWEIFKP